MQTVRDQYVEHAVRCAELAVDIAESPREQRLLKIPALSPAELEQLEDLGRRAVWDGNLISKNARARLYQFGLCDRWNGMNIITTAGLAVLETLDSKVWKQLSR